MRTHLVSRAVVAATLLVGLSTAAKAQEPTQQPAATTPSAQAAVFPKVQLTAGRSTVLPTDFNITRIAVTNPEIADAVVVQPREILIDGKAPGTISLIVWGADERRQYDVVVEQPVTALEQQLRALFPGEDVTVSTSEGATILSGRVSSTNVMRTGRVLLSPAFTVKSASVATHATEPAAETEVQP